jgi:hypothetical protein
MKSATSNSCQFSQTCVSRPAFDSKGRRRPWANVVKGKKIMRPDKRVKQHFLK